MIKSENRKRRNTKYYVDKYKRLHYGVDSIITKYFMQDEYFSPAETVPQPVNYKYTRYCTNRDSFYQEGGLLL